MGIYKHISIKYLLLFILAVSIDQLSKYLIRRLGGFYICNPDISWGIHIPSLFFWFFWIILILFIIFSLQSKYFAPDIFSLFLILSGAISNILDRLFLGCVVDFIDFKFWPVFNLADVFVCAGTLFLVVKRMKK